LAKHFDGGIHLARVCQVLQEFGRDFGRYRLVPAAHLLQIILLFLLQLDNLRFHLLCTLADFLTLFVQAAALFLYAINRFVQRLQFALDLGT